MVAIETDKKTYDVSVLVLTYNAIYEKLLDTVKSILMQNGVDLEIIIADDGSSHKEFDKLSEFFKSYGFTEYVIIENEKNQGTVKNYYSGLLKCSGKYVKAISPGDRLYKKDTLKAWIEYVETHHLRWSYSDYISYRVSEGNIVPVVARAHPRNIDKYRNSSFEEQRWQYLALDDLFVGAAMISELGLQLTYCREIIDKVVYAEDNVYRLMMFDGVPGGFYPIHTILYEYGDGISTTDDDKWGSLLEKDHEETNKIIYSRENIDAFQKKLKKAISIITGKNKFKKLLIKGFIPYKLSEDRQTIGYLP